MKVCVLLLLFLAHQSFAYHVTISQVRNRWKETVAPVASECIPKSGVKEEVIDEFFKFGTMPDDHSFKCFLYCIGVKLQVFDSADEIWPRHLVQNFEFVDPPLAKKCERIVEPDPCQKAYLLFKCLLDGLSERFSF